MAKNKNGKSESLGSSRAASVAKSAKDKAYGKETRTYQKPTKLYGSDSKSKKY